MFSIGDKAKVTREIRRVDGLSVARVGEVVFITSVFNSKENDGVQIVGIDFYNKTRLPITNIVVSYGIPLTSV